MATALGAALTLAGCTAAAASSAAATSGTAKASAGQPASPPGRVHVTAYSTMTTPSSPPSSPAPSATTGPPRRSHPAARVSAHGGELELKLTHGTFRLNIADLDAKFVQGTSHEPVFPRTCSTYVSVSDPVPIVPGSGTGAYRGIAGTFAMSLTLNEVSWQPMHHVAEHPPPGHRAVGRRKDH
jgi:hypothetical protein